MTEKPKPRSTLAEKELDKAQRQFDDFDNQVKDLTLDRMNMAPKEDVEQQTKIAQSDISQSKDIYLKPKKSIPSREKFNEDYRKDYNFQKEFVFFIAENKEIIGESIDLWTKPFAGMPAEEWIVPVNTPVWAPRYVAEQIKRKFYHRLTMKENETVSSDAIGTYQGRIVVDTKVARLDAIPATKNRSIFMGANNFS